MFAAASLLAALAAAPLHTVAGGCLSPAEARQSIAAERLIDIGEAGRLAVASAPGEIVAVNLCRADHRLVYVLAILSANGRVARVSVDARTRTVTDHR